MDIAQYWKDFTDSYANYGSWLWKEVTFSHADQPIWHNYFGWLVLISVFFMLMEWAFPWHQKQGRFRRDFWLDMAYMFFNFFIFSLILFDATSNAVVHFFNDLLASVGIKNLVAFEVMSWPLWAHLLLGFMVRDFVQWWVHRLLHRVPWLWKYHQVHHSVREMGFAAHLRYHWMETVVYRSLEYIPLALIGIGLRDFFIIHIFTLFVGHFNHSNLKVPLGPLKYVFNNPQMHIWHHAMHLPAQRRYGVNFGLTLSIWDYLFGTNYIPHEGRDIELGYPGLEKMPDDMGRQLVYGIVPGVEKEEGSASAERERSS